MSKHKNIIVTGGNNGIGLETAKALYQEGHRVIIASRNEQKNNQAVRNIIGSTQAKNGSIKSFKLDLAKRGSIEDFVKNVKGEFESLDILINNAGLLLTEMELSELNIEMTMTINHFGPFYLTYLLFPLLKNSAEARIINVSSMAHYQSANHVSQDLSLTNSSFGQMGQYYKSKLANVLFTVGLNDRLGKHSNIKTVALHPGIVDSGFGQGSSMFGCFKCFCCCLFVDETTGARTSLRLSKCPFSELRSGEYYHSDTNWKEMSEMARDRKEVNLLWKASEKAYSIVFQP